MSEVMRCIHKFKFSWTPAVLLTRLLVSNFRACWIRLNIPCGPVTAGPELLSRPISHFHLHIEELHRCFWLGGYFMAAVLADASYYRGGFSPCLAISVRRVRVPGGSKFHL